MRRILTIGHNDLRLFLKRKSSFIWLFLVPLVFIYLMGFAARGPNDPANRHPPLFIDNQDTNFLGRIFVDELSAQGLWRVKPEERDSAAGEIRIPADFTGNILLQTPGKVRLLQPKGASEGDAAIIQLRLLRAVVAMNGHLLEAAPQTNALPALTEDQLRAVMAKPNPVSLEASFAGRHPVPSGFNFSLPGNLVAYLMMNLLIFGGAALAAERRNGVIRRLMSCPTTHGEVVQGKIYGLMLLGVVQILFFLVVGRFAFHVNLGANLPGVALTLPRSKATASSGTLCSARPSWSLKSVPGSLPWWTNAWSPEPAIIRVVAPGWPSGIPRYSDPHSMRRLSPARARIFWSAADARSAVTVPNS